MNDLELWKRQRIGRLRQDLDVLFARLCHDFGSPLFDLMGEPPLFEVSEDREQVVVTAEMPDLDPGTLDITLEDDVLSLRGGRESLAGARGQRLLEHRTFAVRLHLPAGVEAEGITARYDHGTLRITLRKRQRPPFTRIAILPG